MTSENVVGEINVEAGSGVLFMDSFRGSPEVTGCAALVLVGDAGQDTEQTVLLVHPLVETDIFSEGDTGVVSAAREAMGAMPINAAVTAVTRAD